MSNFISRLFNLGKRATAELEKKVEPIEELADYMASLSDEQLK